MATEVSSFAQMMKAGGYNKEDVTESSSGDGSEGGDGGESKVLITRDLLGGCCTLDSKDLDLDLQAPSGSEKRLDLESGKVHLQRCNSPNASSSSPGHRHTVQQSQTLPKLQDLKFAPTLKKPLNLFDDPSLDLKLVQSSSTASSGLSSSPSSSNYLSVCTLDKVKSALERAEKRTNKKGSISLSKSSSPASNSSSSTRETENDCEEKSSATFAAGCPSCLLYVLITKSNPKCPRCNTIVPTPGTFKKPRVDLNIPI